MDEKLKQALDEMYSKLDAANAERWAEFGKRLQSLEERDTPPDDQKVLELEARLAEKDTEIKAVNEKIRLLMANPDVPDVGQSRSVGTPDFKGVFLPRLDEVRDSIRAAAPVGSRRAIDTSLFSGGGDLQPETADAFIDLVMEQTTTLSRISNIRMNAPERNLDELKIATRQLVAATEATAPTVADSVTIGQHVLDTVAVILAEDISLRFLEDNIEKGGVEAHIASLLAKQFGSDLNDLAWNGDSTTGTFLVLNDGWSVLFLADADVNDVDLTAETTAPGVLSSIMKGMPQRLLAIPDLVFFAPVGFCQNYADAVAARETAAGDTVMLNGFPNLRYFGRPVIPEPHMSEATAGIDTDELVVLTSASRLAHGVQRDIRVDSQWNGRKRAVEYTLTARVDAEYATGEIVVRGYSLPAALQ